MGKFCVENTFSFSVCLFVLHLFSCTDAFVTSVGIICNHHTRSFASSCSHDPVNARKGQDTNQHELRPLDSFVAECERINSVGTDTVRIVPSRQKMDLKCHRLETRAFGPKSANHFLLVATCEGEGVDIEKLQTLLGCELEQLELSKVEERSGFKAGTVPPFGLERPNQFQLVLDKRFVERISSSASTNLICAAGYVHWESIISLDVLLQLETSTVADVSSMSPGSDGNNSNVPRRTLDPTAQRKEFSSLLPIILPPRNLAAFVSRRRDLANPLLPETIELSGEIGLVTSNGKRSASFKFLPSNENLRSLDVSFIFHAGKPLLQEIGPVRGEQMITRIEKGAKVHVKGRTNVFNRDSLLNWSQRNTMECQLLDIAPLGSGSLARNEDPTFKHKPKSLPTENSDPVKFLQLEDIFAVPPSVVLVDSIELLDELELDLGRMRAVSIENDSDGVIGIDCEWQPHQLVERNQPRPVLVMQLSLQRLGKIYILDLFQLLRPMCPVDEPMTSAEKRLDTVIETLFSTSELIKVGYQLYFDLSRLAASYPHVKSFQSVKSVLEIDALIKRVLQVNKQKKSRGITMSLASMTMHYLEKGINKEQQISEWMQRPLSQEQLQYAALDAASTPALLAAVLESTDAYIDPCVPIVKRWEGDSSFQKMLSSWTFQLIPAEHAAVLPDAKKIVGETRVLAKSRITDRRQPANS